MVVRQSVLFLRVGASLSLVITRPITEVRSRRSSLFAIAYIAYTEVVAVLERQLSECGACNENMYMGKAGRIQCPGSWECPAFLNGLSKSFKTGVVYKLLTWSIAVRFRAKSPRSCDASQAKLYSSSSSRPVPSHLESGNGRAGSNRIDKPWSATNSESGGHVVERDVGLS
jgi:hypothetical protein